MTKAKKQYHIFKRRQRDHDDEVLEIEALVRPGLSEVVIRLTVEHVREALRRNGQADTQNCAAGVCLPYYKDRFKHPVTGLVDWWRRRVYILEPRKAGNKTRTCRVYAHYDDVEELFDTDAGLKKLLKRLEIKGYMDITLYPIKKGRHPVTQKKLSPSGPSGPSGKVRQPRRIGSDLRWYNHMMSKKAA
jgi:hypothetical protein